LTFQLDDAVLRVVPDHSQNGPTPQPLVQLIAPRHGPAIPAVGDPKLLHGNVDQPIRPWSLWGQPRYQ
jgi:hypothetical protein